MWLCKKKLREFIKEYNNRYKSTIILTSHYMGDVEALCKRVIVINHGEILFDGLLANLVKKHAPYKTITLDFEENIDPEKFEDLGKVKSYDPPQLILSVKSEKLNDVVAKLIKNHKIRDLNIEDPDIEDVIRDVFTKANE